MSATIVVGFDETPCSERALTEAAREAVLRDAELVVVHAFPPVYPSSPVAHIPADLVAERRQEARLVATRGSDAATARYPSLPAVSRAVAGSPADVLAAAAKDAELLVVGNRGRGGFAGLLLGSVSLRTLARAECPVTVVRGGSSWPNNRIVAALDLDDANDELLDFAFAEAERRSLPLRVIHVWNQAWFLRSDAWHDADTAAKEILAGLHERLAAMLDPWTAGYPDVSVTHTVLDAGSIAKMLIQASEYTDLLVVGGRRRPDGHGMRLGPTAHALVHHADCPVSVVPIGRPAGHAAASDSPKTSGR